MLPTPTLLMDPEDPWGELGGIPLPKLEQALVDAIIAGDLAEVRRCVALNADVKLRITRKDDREHCSPLGLALRHGETLAKPLVEALLETRGSSRRDLFQDFIINAGGSSSDAMMCWFFVEHQGELQSADRGACWRALSSRGRWKVMHDCRDILWGWECVHTGVNAYTASFVWVRALLSQDPMAGVVKGWMQEVLMRFDAIDRGIGKTILDELALQCSNNAHAACRHTLVEELAALIRRGSRLPDMTQSAVNPHMGVLLREAIAKVDAETCARALECDTVEVGAGGSARQGRL